MTIDILQNGNPYSRHWTVVRNLMIVLFGAAILVHANATRAASTEEAVAKLAADLGAQLEKRKIKKLAIYGFSEISGGGSTFGDFLSEELITAMFGVGEFDVVERRELNRVLSEHESYGAGIFDAESIAKFGKLLGIEAIITGTITNLGKSLKTNVRAIGVESGRVFAASSASIDVDPVIEQLLSQAGYSVQNPTASHGSSSTKIGKKFRNSLFEVTPTSVIVHARNPNEAIVTVEIKNIASHEIKIASATGNTGRREGASTTAGDTFKFYEFDGLSRFKSYDNLADVAISLVPGGKIIGSWELTKKRSTTREILGDTLYLRDTFYVLSKSKSRKVDVHLEDLKIKRQ
ncbi:MAG: hypothetical protein HKN50_10890 [Gammaproteobacteria bacterium]|nr:hypothetical protein [Gammaproteobacteria bacterium]